MLCAGRLKMFIHHRKKSRKNKIELKQHLAVSLLTIYHIQLYFHTSTCKTFCSKTKFISILYERSEENFYSIVFLHLDSRSNYKISNMFPIGCISVELNKNKIRQILTNH